MTAHEDNAVQMLRRHWDRLGVTVACPICGSNGWNIDQGAEVFVPAVGSAANGGPAQFSDASSAYALHCGRCGFVAQFMRRVVDEAGRETGGEIPT